MAADHFVDLYAIRVKKKFSRDLEYHLLGSAGEDKIDSAFVVHDFLTTTERIYKDDDRGDFVIREDEPTVDEEDELIYGFITAGKTGSSFDVVDSKAPTDRVEYGPGHAAMRKFFYLFYLPKNADTGAMILHRIGGDGIHGYLAHNIARYFAEAVGDCLLEVRPIYADLRDNPDAKVKELRVIAYKKKTEAEIAASGNQSASRKAEKAFSLSLPHGQIPHNILTRLFGSQNAKGVALTQLKRFFEVTWDDYITDTRAVVMVGTRKRTVKIAQEFNYNTLIAITDQIVIEDGRPTIESLKTAALAQLRDLAEMGPLG